MTRRNLHHYYRRRAWRRYSHEFRRLRSNTNEIIKSRRDFPPVVVTGTDATIIDLSSASSAAIDFRTLVLLFSYATFRPSGFPLNCRLSTADPFVLVNRDRRVSIKTPAHGDRLPFNSRLGIPQLFAGTPSVRAVWHAVTVDRSNDDIVIVTVGNWQVHTTIFRRVTFTKTISKVGYAGFFRVDFGERRLGIIDSVEKLRDWR